MRRFRGTFDGALPTVALTAPTLLVHAELPQPLGQGAVRLDGRDVQVEWEPPLLRDPVGIVVWVLFGVPLLLWILIWTSLSHSLLAPNDNVRSDHGRWRIRRLKLRRDERTGLRVVDGVLWIEDAILCNSKRDASELRVTVRLQLRETAIEPAREYAELTRKAKLVS